MEVVSNNVEADLSTDLKIKLAWTRRSLAYDQARLITFAVLDKWTNKLFARMYEDPPQNFRRVSMQQCLSADQKLWVKLSEACRASILPVLVAGVERRPLDAAIALWSDHADVAYLLQPLPLSGSNRNDDKGTSSGKQKSRVKAKSAPYGKQNSKGKGNSGSKGKGKGQKGKGGLSIPKGCCSKTQDGKNICFAFNDKGCSKCAAGQECEKGWHLCGYRGCHKDHSMSVCTME